MFAKYDKEILTALASSFCAGVGGTALVASFAADQLWLLVAMPSCLAALYLITKAQNMKDERIARWLNRGVDSPSDIKP